MVDPINPPLGTKAELELAGEYLDCVENLREGSVLNGYQMRDLDRAAFRVRRALQQLERALEQLDD
jgi:hypothetical protein